MADPNPNVPARKKPAPGQPAVPWNPDALAEKVWAASGISPDERAAALTLAYRSAVEALQATKVVVISHRGLVTDSITSPDHSAIAKARDQIFALSGVEQAAKSHNSGGDLVIPLPPWAQIQIGAAPSPLPTLPVPVLQEIVGDCATPAPTDEIRPGQDGK